MHTFSFQTTTRTWFQGLLLALLLIAPAPTPVLAQDTDTYDQDSIVKEAGAFLGDTTEGLAKVIEKAFKEQGRPTGYIRGEEIAGAITVGLRYGQGTLTLKKGGTTPVYWQGPSVGFDLGGNASKVFILVYNADRPEVLFKRFPAVDGSLYYVAGAGINYQRRDGVVLAPIRLGVGLRSGVSIGYTNYTRHKTLNPL